ncbi:MAG: hypothetical protein DRP45_11150 [Candidatus Zixiibacteriota bacterium]|nr:MAG: hypothetical protein DRP45_11150 [candidate division Zixibacteria bacterium]
MKWLLENFWIKVAAFVIGFLIWLHVATEKEYHYELKLPVTEVSLNEGLALSKPPPDSVLVTVSATGKQLLREKWRDRGLRLSANQYQAGRYTLSLTSATTFLAFQTADISLDEVISPTSAQLDIDIESSADVLIRADLQTSADDGFAVSQPVIIDPPSVELIGPRSMLGGARPVFTEKRTLEGLRNTVVIRLAVLPPPRYGLRVEPDSVTVTIPVVPIKTRVFDKLPVVIFNAPPSVRLRVEPDHIRAEITGPPETIDELSFNNLTVSVDYRQKGDNGWTAVQLDCPAGYRVKRISVDSVTIVDDSHANPGD